MSLYTNKLAHALRSNPHTSWTGILSTNKVVETDSGYLSFNRDRELIALVSDDPRGGYNYGHVLRVNPDTHSDGPSDGALWAALIIVANQRIEANTADLLFRRYRYWIQSRGKYTPCYAQDRDDVFVLTDSYGEAVLALAEMIRRFDPYLRDGGPLDPEDIPESDGSGPLPGSGIRWILDMRCFDVYGGIMACWDSLDPNTEAGNELCP